MEYMTKKEYEEKKAVIQKEINKYAKRGLYGWAAVVGSIIATVTIANTIPFKVLGLSSTMGFALYTLFCPITKRESARYELGELKEQRLSELEQRVGEEYKK